MSDVGIWAETDKPAKFTVTRKNTLAQDELMDSCKKIAKVFHLKCGWYGLSDHIVFYKPAIPFIRIFRVHVLEINLRVIAIGDDVDAEFKLEDPLYEGLLFMAQKVIEKWLENHPRKRK